MDPRGHAGPDRRRRRHARQRAGTLSTEAGPGCVRATVALADAEIVADLLWFCGATAVGERAVPGGVELEAGFATAVDADRAVLTLVERGFAATAVDPGAALEAALDAWMSHARPVRVGRLHVRPAWLDADDDPPEPGEIVVRLDPSRAFGSGSHPSTLACLAAVDRFVAPGSAVLDVGCGSGVLAVAASRLGASSVVAVDLDPVAVAATSANATANGVRVDVRHGSIHAVDATFDLVLANIGAATVLALAAELAARVAPGGRLVLAGLYEDRAGEVAAALAEHGVVEVERRVDEGWACLIHQTPPAIEHTVRRRHVGAHEMKEHDEPT